MPTQRLRRMTKMMRRGRRTGRGLLGRLRPIGTTFSKESKNRIANKRSIASPSNPFPLLNANQLTPSSRYMQLNYVQVVTLTGAIAGVTGTVQQFRLNSVFDPDLTGVGHQPYGYDTITGLYSVYKVMYVDVEVEFIQPDTQVAGTYGVVCLQSTNDAFAVGGKSLQTLDEKPNCWTGLIPIGAGQNRAVCKFSMPLHELAGVDYTTYKTDVGVYASNVASNPGASPLMTIQCCNARGENSFGAVAKVQINFHTKFWQRQTQAIS